MYHARLLCICIIIVIGSRDHSNAHRKLIRWKRKDHPNMIDYGTSRADLMWQGGEFNLPCGSVSSVLERETFVLLGSYSRFPSDVCWELQTQGFSLEEDGWLGVKYPCGRVKYARRSLQTEVQTLGHAVWAVVTDCLGRGLLPDIMFWDDVDRPDLDDC